MSKNLNFLVLLGVPSYGINFTAQNQFSYHDVIVNYDVPPTMNNMGLAWWPSPSITTEKVIMATSFNIAGIMIWEITQGKKKST